MLLRNLTFLLFQTCIVLHLGLPADPVQSTLAVSSITISSLSFINTMVGYKFRAFQFKSKLKGVFKYMLCTFDELALSVVSIVFGLKFIFYTTFLYLIFSFDLKKAKTSMEPLMYLNNVENSKDLPSFQHDRIYHRLYLLVATTMFMSVVCLSHVLSYNFCPFSSVLINFCQREAIYIALYIVSTVFYINAGVELYVWKTQGRTLTDWMWLHSRQEHSTIEIWIAQESER